jgi:RNA polymerase sigma-70 factor, ECF subfamily
MRPNPAKTAVARAAPGREPATDSSEQGAVRFERAVLPHLNRVYRAALCLTGDQASAEDLVLETFATAAAAYGQIQPDGGVAAWLYRHLITAFASSSRLPQLSASQPLPACGARDPQLPRGRSPGRGWPALAEITALARLPGADVKRTLLELPQELRIVVYLADVEDLACREIATIMAVPPEAVTSRLRHGRRQLGQLLLDHAATRGRTSSVRP